MRIHFGEWLDGRLPRMAVGEAVVGKVWAGPGRLLEALAPNDWAFWGMKAGWGE